MKKPIKLLFIGLAAIISLLLIAIITLPLIIDPNDYKPEIIKLVKDNTGRELKIPGQIDLSVFPWLGIKLGKVELSNARHFGKQAFAKVETVDVRIKLLPLLKKEIQVGQIKLDGLNLNLQRNRNGRNNWNNLSKPPQTTSKKSESKTSPEVSQNLVLAGLTVGGVHITNTQLNWQDQQNKQTAKINIINLQTGDITPDKPIPFTLESHFTSSKPNIKGQMSLKTTARINTDEKIFMLSDLKLSSQLQGKDLPGNKLDLQLSSDSLTVNQDKQTLNVNALQLSSLGVRLYADAQVTQLNKQPRYKINIASDAFSAKDVAQQLNIKLPKTADENALASVKLSSKLVGDLNNVSVNPLSIQLDDSSLTGHVKINNFKKPALRYELSLDDIDLDRYLPPATKKTTASAPSKQVAQTPLPLELLRALDVKGKITINKLKLSNARSEKIHMTTTAKNGLIRLYPLGAKMYKGTYKGDIQIDARDNTPAFSMNESLSNITIGPLMKDIWGDDKVQGVANLKAILTARGNTPFNIRKTLNGTASFKFENGVVKGINIAAYERALKAKLKGQAVAKETEAVQTDFSAITGTLQVRNGVAKNQDLSASLPHARIQGNGSANLVNETLDYTVYAKFTSTAEAQNSKSYAQINKTPLPIQIKGSFAKPSISVDYSYVLKALTKKKLDKKKAAVKKDAKKKLEKKAGDALKKLLRF